MTTTIALSLGNRTDLFEPTAVQRPARNWLTRAMRRLRLRFAVWHVRGELAQLPAIVLSDLDLDSAVYSATRLLVRRAIIRRKPGGRRWTS